MNAKAPGETPQSTGWGVFWICLSMLLFICMDGIAKVLIQTYPTVEVIWARFTFHMLFMAPLILRRFPETVVARAPWLQVLRGAMVLMTNFFIVMALWSLPLAEVSVLAAVNPLIVTALSAPILGEKVGVRRWIGVVVGFLGVLVILRPGSAIFQAAALLPLVGAFGYAINQLTTRRLGRIDHPLTTVFYTALLGCVIMTAVVPFVWVTPDPAGWGLMAVIGVLSLGGNIAGTKAFQVAAAAVVTPFNYSALIWATLFGFFVFGDLPDGGTVAGALVIVASSLYVLRRRRRVRGTTD